MPSLSQKIDRASYYFRNIVQDVAPQGLFRRRLFTILDRALVGDANYIVDRVNYYNKLSKPVELPQEARRIQSIPMSRSMYYYDLKEHARYYPRQFRLNYRFGDLTGAPDSPSFVKSRPIGGNNANSVLMKLDKFRHFHFPTDRTAFRDKKPMAVWRGAPHNAKRAALLRRYRGHPLCDVGQPDDRLTALRRAGFLSIADQMEFRYILSIEGNDVATNLKWIMASNSLCFMPAPVYETWFMEGLVEAGRHYVRLRPDFEDLEEKILYYERHPDEALAIIAAANAYVRTFLDEPREQLISLLVMYKYFVLTGQLKPDRRYAGLIGA